MQLPAWMRRHPILGVLFFLVLLSILGWIVYFGYHVVNDIWLIRSGQSPLKLAEQKRFQATMSKYFAQAVPSKEDLERINVSTNLPTLGSPSAPVRIVAFVDYQCPFSKQAAPMFRDFMKRHAQDAFFILRDYPIRDVHPDAERVSVAARCVYRQLAEKPDAFWAYYDRLFTSQSAQSATDLRLYASQAGVDVTAYDACIADPSVLTAVQQSSSEAQAVGAGGTPTFFFNGVMIEGAMDSDSLETIFQEAKKQASS